MKIDLTNITICAVDTITPQLAARAIKESVARCDFGDAILFSDITPDEGPFRHVKINTITSKQDYSQFILKDLYHFIDTPFVLIVQWDGYVIDASAWKTPFLHYDYIGAIWHWYDDGLTVGNGGFSLRSKKLLEALQDSRFSYAENHPEDELICRVYRPELEKDYDIRFAPEHIADWFSYEYDNRSPESTPTFGFHGAFNMWRHVDDNELCNIIELCSPDFFNSSSFYVLLARCVVLGRHVAAKALYRRLKQYRNASEIYHSMESLYKNNELTKRCFTVCENLMHLP